MANKSTGGLELWLPEMSDDIGGPNGTIEKHLPENFEKIDDGFTDLKQEVDAHKAEKATQASLGHIKLQEDFINGTLQSGATGEIKYAKNDLGLVTLIFNFSPNTESINTVVCTLPIGYRPAMLGSNGIIPIPTTNVSTGSTGASLYIRSNGRISISGTRNYTGTELLAGSVTFYAE
jgi:hypothetical protein